MEEKIKIYIPESINNILLKDMELFEFFKKNGTLNKNDFLNTLIINYYSKYQEGLNETLEKIKVAVSKNSKLKKSDIDLMSEDILKIVNSNTSFNQTEAKDVTLSLKPTLDKAALLIDLIQEFDLNNNSLSGYFRNMFTSYALLPQDKREMIIFKDSFDKIYDALLNNKKLYFVTKRNKASHIVSPYAVTSSKEELFNYLLCEKDGKAYSYRLNRLEKVNVLNESASFSDINIEIFNKMIKKGPQYSFKPNDLKGEIKVLLTDKGKEQYKMRYMLRPQYTRIEGDYYYFDCSPEQAFQYFSKFGKHAVILSPSTLVDNLYSFYSMGKKAYSRIKFNDKAKDDK